MAKKVFLDPGHGGSDPGAVANGLQEKQLTLNICKQIRDILTSEYGDVHVKLSREGDTYLSLEERAKRANAWGADLFVSVHINAGGGTGFESYVHTSQNSKTVNLRNTIHGEIMRHLDVRDRGKKVANFAVLRLTAMPAVLTENLFIDHADDAKKLKSSAYIAVIARGHAEGIAKALGLKKKAQPKPNQPKSNPGSSSGVYYRVVAGSFKDRENAEQRVAALRKAGFESFIDTYKK